MKYIRSQEVFIQSLNKIKMEALTKRVSELESAVSGLTNIFGGEGRNEGGQRPDLESNVIQIERKVYTLLYVTNLHNNVLLFLEEMLSRKLSREEVNAGLEKMLAYITKEEEKDKHVANEQ